MGSGQTSMETTNEDYERIAVKVMSQYIVLGSILLPVASNGHVKIRSYTTTP